jgi:chromosome segregation ATPase
MQEIINSINMLHEQLQLLTEKYVELEKRVTNTREDLDSLGDFSLQLQQDVAAMGEATIDLQETVSDVTGFLSDVFGEEEEEKPTSEDADVETQNTIAQAQD